jgi:hypothetical protein
MKQDLELYLKRRVFKEDYTIGTLGLTGYDECKNVIEKDPFFATR